MRQLFFLFLLSLGLGSAIAQPIADDASGSNVSGNEGSSKTGDAHSGPDSANSEGSTQTAQAEISEENPEASAEAATATGTGDDAGLLDKMDAAFGEYVVGPIETVLFFDVAVWTQDYSIPFIVLWLVIGAVFFTLRMGFINVRGFIHAINVTRGKYDNPHETGEVSHFQALSSALSATVGLGNIAGVAIAVSMGGPGAVFWMVMAGFFGMSSKFTECTLGQMYRMVDDKGRISGGPMRYLRNGLGEVGVPRLGRFLSVLFAVMCIGGSFGGGNMFQANQSGAQLGSMVPFFGTDAGKVLYGVLLAAAVGVVIIGGIQRIGKAAEKIVPFMCGIYVLAGMVILVVNADKVPAAFGTIFSEAFSPASIAGGWMGVLIIGFQRAAFSNEAGVGSASIAHSAASTEEPVREGIVALLEPFIDTILVCTMTGLVVVVTGAYQLDTAGDGVLMTATAFTSVLPWFDVVLSVAVILFAFSTMISWSYYGERCWTFLFGAESTRIYQFCFLGCVVFGASVKLGSVLGFSDLMVLGMAFPNILGMYFLSTKVKGRLNEYWGRFQSGEMKEVK